MTKVGLQLPRSPGGPGRLAWDRQVNLRADAVTVPHLTPVAPCRFGYRVLGLVHRDHPPVRVGG
ncbi:hypothetical protein MHPYR_440024 [uncultured Mycobacterium sp.]|uniref:Uncharacterized protein n=1 Tax=uncultured Mycobacterium sp. TaxID=171292 RepID=A0A1Y5PFQ9_9MYCO|nr:hypothetical protein MHPYR_440024 [uncultured Mycobacterium sp.]